MKAFLKLILIAVLIFLTSAVLAPILYRWLPFKFERIFNRLVMIFFLAAVAYAVKRRSLSFPFGMLARTGENARALTVSFLAGVLTLCVMTGLRILLGDAVWGLAELTWSGWFFLLVKITVSSFLIGLIEECFFRGFVYANLREKLFLGVVPAFIVTNLFYSVLHFTHKSKPFIGAEPGFVDSLRLMAGAFPSPAAWMTLWPSFFGLFLFGMVLSVLSVRTGSLYAPIGFHAGCVFVSKLDGNFANFLNRNVWLFGTSNHYDGLLGWCLLGLTAFLLAKILGAKKFISPRLATCLIVWISLGTVSGSGFALEPANSETSREGEDGTSSGGLIFRRPHSTETILEPLSAGQNMDSVATTAVGESLQETVSPGTAEPKVIPENFPTAIIETVIQRTEPEPARKLPSSIPKESVELNPMGETGGKAIDSSDAGHGGLSSVAAPAGGAIPVSDPLRTVKARPAKKKGVKKPDSSYLLSQHLSGAQAFVIYDEVTTIEGMWEGDRFIFPGLDDSASIVVGEKQCLDSSLPSIVMAPIKGAVRRLIFHEVPPGFSLILRYGAADRHYLEKDPPRGYLKIWAGNHLLSRVPMPAEKGWRQEKINLGVAAFLRRPLVLTVDLASDNPETLDFSFDLRVK